MSSSMTTTAVLPPAVRDYYDRLLLMTAYPTLIYTKFAQRRVLPEKSGDTIVFRRYARLPTVPIPLVDGITPPGTPLSVTDIKARVSFYGNFVTVTNQVELTVEDPVLNQSARLLAQNMAQTVDEVTRDVLASTSSVLQCSNGVNGGTPTELTKADIDAAVVTLLGNDADMISEVITGTDQFSTSAIRPAFWGFIDTAILADLEGVSNFVNTSQYPGNQSVVLDAEWGATGNVRWLYSSVGSVSSASPAVYNNFIVGKEAYAVVNLRSASGDFYIKPLGSAGASDPLNQRGSVGWQQPFVSRILNDSFMLNLMSTAS
jgi:N4-gp56 family major capsid protein